MALMDGLNQQKLFYTIWLFQTIIMKHGEDTLKKSWRNYWNLFNVPFIYYHLRRLETTPVTTLNSSSAERLKLLGSRSDSLKYPDFATTPLAPEGKLEMPERQTVVTVAENKTMMFKKEILEKTTGTKMLQLNSETGCKGVVKLISYH